MAYKRVLLKLSGESLIGQEAFGICQEACAKLALAIIALKKAHIEVGVVIGGGNIFRGIHLETLGLERTAADHMGMLATLINGLALQQALINNKCSAKVMSALDCPKVVDTYSLRRAEEYFAEGSVLIFVGGTGNPYFTTDTAAALRASEIKADALLKATKVDGVYNKDPLIYPEAVKYETLTYSQALADDLKVMDATSIALCRANRIPIFVFNMSLFEENTIVDALSQQHLGTLVKGE